MTKRFLIYSVVGLLSSGAVVGCNLVNNKADQALSPLESAQQPMPVQMDQRFIEMMIPHHQDAIVMADLALTRAKRPDLKTMAEAIKKTQTREIQDMRTWYKKWYGGEVPALSLPDMGMMGNPQNQGQRTSPGMMAPDRGMMNRTAALEVLKKAPDFDKEFVRQMIPHHQMAVMMSQTASKQATHPEIRTLAQAIITSQNAEIAQMQGWQQAWNR